MSDSREIAIPERKSEGLLAQIVEAAKNPAVDADKMQAMANLAISLQDREMLLEFNRDLNAAMMEMPVISKNNEIIINDRNGNFVRKQGSFAAFEDINRVVKPILQRHNLALRFDVGENSQEVDDGNGGSATRTMVTVTPILSHANGHTERGGTMSLPADTSGGKNPVQAVGSTTKYGMRYSMAAMLNIVQEGVDDDGNAGRSGGVVKSLTHEREQTVRNEAKEAHDKGAYMDWFNRQSAKDRSFLVTSGLHAEYGDGTALPPPKPTTTTMIEPEPKRETPSQTRSGKRTPRQWVDAYKGEIDKCYGIEALDRLEDAQHDNMANLKAHDPALWKEADDHALKRREDIENGRLV